MPPPDQLTQAHHLYNSTMKTQHNLQSYKQKREESTQMPGEENMREEESQKDKRKEEMDKRERGKQKII